MSKWHDRCQKINPPAELSNIQRGKLIKIEGALAKMLHDFVGSPNTEVVRSRLKEHLRAMLERACRANALHVDIRFKVTDSEQDMISIIPENESTEMLLEMLNRRVSDAGA